MGILDLIRRLLGLPSTGAAGGIQPLPAGAAEKHDAAQLALRLGIPLARLQGVDRSYREFNIPKRSGGVRPIAAPNPDLMAVQRAINRRLLARLPVHPCATGFRRGYSIVTNAAPHAGRAVVLRMDIRDFFGATRAERVHRYFRVIGWSEEAAGLITALCTRNGALPQGAPTSPTLSNLVNFRLDARLAGMARQPRCVRRNPKTLKQVRPAPVDQAAGDGIFYTRYADDLTFSFGRDDHDAVEAVIWLSKRILSDSGYRLHHKRKLTIRRRHQRQSITGLVVNDAVGLARGTRRWLRAVRHHLATDREASLTPAQLAGWEALEQMVRLQSPAGGAD